MAQTVGIVGGGHNALVAAAYLARAGVETVVYERLSGTGGAAVSQRPWDDFEARLSRYSYLVSLLPESIVQDLGLDLELRSRPTASYTPYGDSGLLAETEESGRTRASFAELTGSDDDYAAWQAFYGEVAELASAIAPTLTEPLPRAGDLRSSVEPRIWDDVIDRPLGEAIERRFADDLVRGVVATDALIGTFASMRDPSLIQNRCFLYHVIGNGTGEWRVPVGGMGRVTRELDRAAREAGAEIRTSTTVTGVETDDAGVTVLGDGFADRHDYVLAGVAPQVLARLRGIDAPGSPLGSQFKINLLVSRLPRLRSGADPAEAFAGTFHLGEAYTELEQAYAEAAAGALPARACGELYCHTLTDDSILGAELAASGAHTLTYFGLHTPGTVLNRTSAPLAYERFLAGLNDYLAEPLEPLILGVEYKTPGDIERDLAMPGGHIFHGDLAWPWLADDETAATPAQQWGVATDHPRVLMCGSGARRGGAVSGIGGHNAAHALLDFDS